MQLILDVLDFPESLLATAGSPGPSWGFQLFAGADVFADRDKAAVVAEAVRQMRARLSEDPAGS